MGAETRSVEEVLASWNTPTHDAGYDLVVGVPVPEGDTRATASVDPRDAFPGAFGGGDVERITGDYDSHKKGELQAEIDLRNAERPEDEQIEPEGTNKADLVAALEEDDDNEEE